MDVAGGIGAQDQPPIPNENRYTDGQNANGGGDWGEQQQNEGDTQGGGPVDGASKRKGRTSKVSGHSPLKTKKEGVSPDSGDENESPSARQ